MHQQTSWKTTNPSASSPKHLTKLPEICTVLNRGRDFGCATFPLAASLLGPADKLSLAKIYAQTHTRIHKNSIWITIWVAQHAYSAKHLCNSQCGQVAPVWGRVLACLVCLKRNILKFPLYCIFLQWKLGKHVQNLLSNTKQSIINDWLIDWLVR